MSRADDAAAAEDAATADRLATLLADHALPTVQATLDERVLVSIAGVHAIGSVGAATHVAAHLPALFAEVDAGSMSLAVRYAFDGLTFHETATTAGPYSR